MIYELPDDWYDQYRPRIRAVTTDAVLHAARTYVRPDAMQIVIVGDPAAIRTPVEALAFGPVDVIDV